MEDVCGDFVILHLIRLRYLQKVPKSFHALNAKGSLTLYGMLLSLQCTMRMLLAFQK